MDPEGYYHLEVDIANYDPFIGKTKLMFRSLHVIPSSSMTFWRNFRKIVAADAAHLNGKFGGVINMLTTKDANNQNLTLMYSIVEETSIGIALLPRQPTIYL